jgi:tetratricopeptide (TPR) repeat protein
MRKFICLGIIAFTVSLNLNNPVRTQALIGVNKVMYSHESQQKNKQLAQLSTESSTVTETKKAFERAREYDMKYQIDEAISEYTRAIELDPNYAEAYLSRSAVLAKDNAQRDDQKINYPIVGWASCPPSLEELARFCSTQRDFGIFFYLEVPKSS